MAKAQQNGGMEFGGFEDEYRGFDPYEEDGGHGPLILFLAIGVILVFAAVVWNTYSQGVRGDGQRLPVISADAAPYKRAPEDAGGAETPDLNRRIYDQIDGSNREDIVIAAALRAERADEGPSADDVLQGGPPMELRPTLGDPIEVEPAPKPVAAEPIETAVAPPPRRQPDAAPTSQPVAEAPASRFAFDYSGAYLVQIAALRSESAAEEAWSRAAGASPSLYQGAQKRIQRADLGARGVFYRLRAGAFAERAAATEFCDALKAGGGDCIVVRNE
ncbi:MAG: SPOR domain-containing protein [Pseudomonadota bacterium]